jgi:two-component system cell cycle sensor histidine kinase/response regulator CckA
VPERRGARKALGLVRSEEPGDSELIHREMVRRSPNPIFLVDAATARVLETNPAAARMLGYELAELDGIEFHRVDAGGEARVARLIEQVAEHHHDIFGETEMLRRDGSVVPVELSGNLLIVGGREVVFFFARDITDRKAAEDERCRLERQLWHSQKHESIGRLAGGIAHDFNNLLMAIMLNVDIVRDQLPENHPVRDELDEIEEASRRARDLTRQLLAFSGRQVLKPRPVRLNHVVAEMERLVRRTIGEDIRLEVSLEANEGVVFVDLGQMEQVLLNLVVNARDAMPEGGVLSVRTRNAELGEAFCRSHPSSRPGPYAVLTVRDTGVGMDAETQARIFEPFFTTKRRGGTGLGLATVYGIVKQSGGNIWVESRLGQGTTFDVYLPRAQGDPAAAHAPLDPREPLEQFRGTETVLVVEDETAVRTLVSGLLEEQGYTVLQAESPTAALEAHDRLRGSGRRVGVAVVDVVMPGMSGPKLVDRLRADGLAAPVLFMSGYPGELTPERGDGFMAKPFTRLQLVREVRRIIDG